MSEQTYAGLIKELSWDYFKFVWDQCEVDVGPDPFGMYCMGNEL